MNWFIISNIDKLKKLLCRHDYERFGFREEEHNNIRFSMRLYKCKKCGKEIWVDGRNDYIGK